MRTVLLGAFAVAALVVLQGSALAADKLAYVESQKVLDNFGKANANPLVPGGAYEVQTNRRIKNGNIEIHSKETDIFYIMDGSATLLMGGTAVEPKETRPNQLTAKDISAPEVHELKKGDVVVIPAGVPHWFKQVNGSIDYLVVKSKTP